MRRDFLAHVDADGSTGQSAMVAEAVSLHRSVLG